MDETDEVCLVEWNVANGRAFQSERFGNRHGTTVGFGSGSAAFRQQSGEPAGNSRGQQPGSGRTQSFAQGTAAADRRAPFVDRTPTKATGGREQPGGGRRRGAAQRSSSVARIAKAWRSRQHYANRSTRPQARAASSERERQCCARD